MSKQDEKEPQTKTEHLTDVERKVGGNDTERERKTREADTKNPYPHKLRD